MLRLQGSVATRLPELQLVLDALIFYLSIWKGESLPGMALMNLRYRDERAAVPTASGVGGPGLSVGQRTSFGAGTVLLRYCWARAAHAVTAGEAASGGWRETVWKGMQRAEGLYRAAALVNALVFLRQGRYRYGLNE